MLLPTRDNVAVVFLDLQEEIIKNSATRESSVLENAAAALGKLAALHRLPVFLSAVPPGGTYLNVLTRGVPNPPRMRTETSAFADAGLVEALKASGRKLLVLSGVASEIVVQRTALDAIAAGYAVHVAVDACGGVSPRTEEAAWRRIVAAGGVTSSAVTLAAELAGDFTTDLGRATLAIMYGLLGR
jgi:nicotinamidase-related amidase